MVKSNAIIYIFPDASLDLNMMIIQVWQIISQMYISMVQTTYDSVY